jgi:hypothetical protein
MQIAGPCCEFIALCAQAVPDSNERTVKVQRAAGMFIRFISGMRLFRPNRVVRVLVVLQQAKAKIKTANSGSGPAQNQGLRDVVSL